MDVKKSWSSVLIFLLIAVVVWVGFSVYFKITDVSVNPNATNYTKYLNPTFELTGFKKVVTKTNALPVSPSTFTSLIQKSN
ncbi:hypothetical protein M0R04_02465 [Candidatus Dojkabacteria bacterium]|jgi:hypothetical protein|nr:hypothetical protein [Candidatus Dojkabacteria bacterium]